MHRKPDRMISTTISRRLADRCLASLFLRCSAVSLVVAVRCRARLRRRRPPSARPWPRPRPSDEAIAAFYRDRDYEHALDRCGGCRPPQRAAGGAVQGRPTTACRWRAMMPRALTRALQRAETEGDRGRIEVAMTRAYPGLGARPARSGALVPKKVDPGILREIAGSRPPHPADAHRRGRPGGLPALACRRSRRTMPG